MHVLYGENRILDASGQDKHEEPYNMFPPGGGCKTPSFSCCQHEDHRAGIIDASSKLSTTSQLHLNAFEEMHVYFKFIPTLTSVKTDSPKIQFKHPYY